MARITFVLFILSVNILCAQSKGKVIVSGKSYLKYDCVSCHGKEGKTPFDLTSAYKKYDQDHLKKYILDPKSFGNTRMPLYKGRITEADLSQLVDYVIFLGKQTHQGKK